MNHLWFFSLHLLFSIALCTLFLLTALVVFSLQDIDGLWLTDQPAVASVRKTLGHVSWSDLAMSTDLCYVGGIGTARWKADVWNFLLLQKCFWRSHQWTGWLKREQVEHVLSIYTLSIHFSFPLSHKCAYFHGGTNEYLLYHHLQLDNEPVLRMTNFLF